MRCTRVNILKSLSEQIGNQHCVLSVYMQSVIKKRLKDFSLAFSGATKESTKHPAETL